MKNVIVAAILIGINTMLSCNGLAYELSGTILDGNSKPIINQTILLNRLKTLGEIELKTPEEIKRLMANDSVDIDLDREAWFCRSDESGHFAFSNLASGVYIITVSEFASQASQQERGKRYEYGSTRVELSSESITNVVIIPVQIDYLSVHGELKSANTGSPMQAELEFSPSLSETGPNISTVTGLMNLIMKVKSDKDGYFLKKNVPSGDYSVRISIYEESNQRHTPEDVGIDIKISKNGDIFISDSDLQWLSHHNLDLKLWSTKERKEKASEARPELLPGWPAESYTINELEPDYVVLRATLENEENPPSGNKPIKYRVIEVLKGEMDSGVGVVEIADVMDAAVQLLKGNPVATYFPQEAILIVALSDGVYTPLDALASRGILPATPENIRRVEASPLEDLTVNPKEKQISLQEAAAIVKRHLVEQNQWFEKASWRIIRLGFGWGFHSNSEGRDLELYVRDDGKVEYFVNWG